MVTAPRALATLLLALGPWLVEAQVPPQGPYRDNLPAGHPAIDYHRLYRPTRHDLVGQLAERVEAGAESLVFDRQFGYLPSLLDRLEVPNDSQALVFSKTSLLSGQINPRRPRALYFNDDVSVGFVPGTGLVELMAFVPGDGVRLYTIAKDANGDPEFARPNVCVQCHQAAATLGVPGPYVGSVSTTATGRPDFTLGTSVTDHRTPLEDRWGGWYVTGEHGTQRHRGNTVARDPSTPAGFVDAANQNLTTLDRFIDPDEYLLPTSDLVALMTLEHQTQMLNLFTRADWEARIAEHDGVLDADEQRARASLVEEIVRYMLFADEAPLSAPVRGASSFTRTFSERGPRDRQGRSLRELDLDTRLFRYRLSYLIYSPLFDSLARDVRDAIYAGLLAALTTAQDSSRHLPADERRTILDIVRDTKTPLPVAWHVDPAAP